MIAPILPRAASHLKESHFSRFLTHVWEKLSGTPCLSYASSRDKHTFIANFFQKQYFWQKPPTELVGRLISLERSQHLEKDLDELYGLFTKQAENTLYYHPQNHEMRKWVKGISSRKQLESFAKELFLHCDTIEALRPLTQLSAAQKRRCLTALRDTSASGQLAAALTAISIELPLTLFGGHLLAILFACTDVLRDICIEAGVLIGCNSSSWFVGVISAPFIEEVVFRGFLHAAIKQILALLQPILQFDDETIQHITIALSAILFGLAHFYNPHENFEMNFIHAISTFVGGLSLGMLYEKYGFLASLFSHSLFNGSLTLADHLLNKIKRCNTISRAVLQSLRVGYT